jgi:hypothetical protein
MKLLIIDMSNYIVLGSKSLLNGVSCGFIGERGEIKGINRQIYMHIPSNLVSTFNISIILSKEFHFEACNLLIYGFQTDHVVILSMVKLKVLDLDSDSG